MELAKLELYQPLIGTYELYVPEGYILEDDENDGLVSIANPDGLSCLTISSYSVEGDVDEKVVNEFFNDLTKGYTPVSERKKLDKEDVLMEQYFYKDGVAWIWWILAYKSRLIAASVNSKILLPDDLLGLYRYIIHNLRPFEVG